MITKKKGQNLIDRAKYVSGDKSSAQFKRIIQDCKETLGGDFFKQKQFYVPSYGSPYVLHMIGQETNKLVASENTSMYNNYAKDMLENSNLEINLFVDDYIDGEIDGLDGSLDTNTLSNTAYEIVIGNSKIIVYPTIIKKTNAKINLQKQCWVLPTKWWFSGKKELIEFRKLLKSFGFKKIIILPTDTFKDEGIPYLECCAVFCEKGYNGPLTVETIQGHTYQYDYSDKEVFYFGDTSNETDMLYRCLELNQPYNWYRPKNEDMYLGRDRERNKRYNKRILNGQGIDVVDTVQNRSLKTEKINKSDLQDLNNLNTFRLILTSLPSGTNYGQGLGTVAVLSPGEMATKKHLVAVLDNVTSKKEADRHLEYLINIGTNIKNKTSSSPTILRPQLQAIPKKDSYEREFGKIK